MSRRGDWICTFTGGLFWPLDPRPDEIHIEDIAHALSLQCRFTGHVRSFYSVAQHAVLVAGAVEGLQDQPPWLQLQALLHDASETYLCDIARPVKQTPEFQSYRDIERQLEAAIFARFGLPTDMHPYVRHCDNVLLVTEARDLMSGFDERWTILHPQLHTALPERITPWSPTRAETVFLEVFRKLYGEYVHAQDSVGHS